MDIPLFLISFAIAGVLVFILTKIQWWLLDWDWKRSQPRLKREIEQRRKDEDEGKPPKPEDYTFAITCDANGLTLAYVRWRKQPPRVIGWDEVTRVIAFNRDLYAYDCVSLSFERMDGSGVIVGELDYGWRRLLDQLTTFLPGCQPGSAWWNSVAYPPFSRKTIEIFLREKTAIDESNAAKR